jgi:hypothetical protein
MACSWAEEDLIWDGVPVHRGECMHCRKLLIYLAYLGCLLHCLTAHVPMHARVLCLPSSTVSVVIGLAVVRGQRRNREYVH